MHLDPSYFTPGEKVFVACSGGPDSVALFFLVKKYSVPLKIKLGLIHFNHRLRGVNSDRDEAFVKKMALAEKVPLVCGRASEKFTPKKKLSLEEWARVQRYAFFQSAAGKFQFNKIATAHTMDDQAETVLMRLLQGTGPQGLSAIRAKMKMGKLEFIRPLLNFTKDEILQFLQRDKIRFRRDASNRSLRFLRNRIRLELLPYLQTRYNPKIRESLSRIPAILEESNQFLAGQQDQAWKHCFLKKSGSCIEWRRSAFLKLHPYLKFRVLERGLKALDAQSGLGFDAWQRIKKGIVSGTYRQSLPRGIDFELTSLKVRIFKCVRVV